MEAGLDQPGRVKMAGFSAECSLKFVGQLNIKDGGKSREKIDEIQFYS